MCFFWNRLSIAIICKKIKIFDTNITERKFLVLTHKNIKLFQRISIKMLQNLLQLLQLPSDKTIKTNDTLYLFVSTSKVSNCVTSRGKYFLL